MSLATLKKKSKSTKNVKIGFKRRMNPSYSQKTKTDNHYDIKPSASYYNLNKKYNIYKNMDCDGDCDVVVAVEPDLTGEHRVEVLSTQHLKKENMEKMKHTKREPDERCHKKNELNYKDDDMSKTASSAQFVMKKKKACLIDGSFLDPTVTIINKKLFFRVKGRGSILTKMRIEVSVVIYENPSESPKTYILKSVDSQENPITTDDQGEAIIDIEANGGTYELDPSPQHGKDVISHEDIYANPNNRIIIKLKPTEESVDTDTTLADNIIIRREYECTVNVENIQTSTSETISALVTTDTTGNNVAQGTLNVNIDTTLVSKLVSENNNIPDYQRETLKDDLQKIIGVSKDNLDIENFGQTYGIQQTSETLDEDLKKIEKASVIIDQLEKKISVVEEEINIISVINEIENSSDTIIDYNFSESTVITSTETQNVLNEIKELTNSVIDSNASETNQTELINLITISNQNNDLYSEIEDTFDESAIEAASLDDDISQYADISNVLDVST
jgi:hypothetical protein